MIRLAIVAVPWVFSVYFSIRWRYRGSSGKQYRKSCILNFHRLPDLQATASLHGIQPTRIVKLAFLSDDELHSQNKVIRFKYFNRRNFVFSLKFSTKANFSVALDTRGFNGHSSVADVIWSGVPIVR